MHAPLHAHPHAPALRRWLVACIVAVVLAVGVGGITRLTESGLSITEWNPIRGVLPPLSTAAWAEEFAKFQRIPQAGTTHAGMTQTEFVWIYWWEWFHRILARGVGLVFALPYVLLLWRRRIPRPLLPRLTALPLLTLAQGALGWYMVTSGLSERSTVSAYRLAAHLTLALAILAIALWTWADLRPSHADATPVPLRWRRAMAGLTAAVLVTIVSGAFVAGLRAGTIYNTFPLMGGQWVPPGYLQPGGWWANAFENPIAAQFHHRVLAVSTGLAALVLAWGAGRAALSGRVRRAVRLTGVVAVTQVALGIATLLLAVPVLLGALHQLTGVALFSAALLALHATRRGAVS